MKESSKDWVAVSAWFDEKAEALVRDLWRKMAEAGVDESLHKGPYRPHITLGIWEKVQINAASKRLAAVVSELSMLEVTFRAIGIFPGHPAHQDRKPGVYLTPTITPELRGLHETVHSVMHEVSTGSIHRHVPGRWEPHCTVAWSLTSRLISPATEVVIRTGVLPLSVTIERLGIIKTPSEVEFGSVTLSAAYACFKDPIGGKPNFETE